MIHTAIIYATIAHNGQKRKGTELPYIIHPLEVMQILSTITTSEDVIIAGVLHDVIEDTRISLDDINKTFGNRVAQLVKACTVSKESTWENRKQSIINKLFHVQTETALVLCADKLSNLRSIIYDLSIENESIWQRFSASKEKVIWYYKELGNAINQRDDLPIHIKQEYNSLLKKLN